MIDAFLEEQLVKLNIGRQEFSELLIRLLDYGVISREESQVEATLYDRYLQCDALVEDYLHILGVRIQHDRQFTFVRLFPPGAVVPGLIDEDDAPFNNGFRSKPTQQEVAVILVLRAEYEKSLREGLIDESGCAMLSVEGLAIAMSNLLKRSLPEGQVERKTLFRRLRQLRLIQYNVEQEFDNDESWLTIHPSITSFVSAEVLAGLLGDAPESNEQAESPNRVTHESTLFSAAETAHPENAEQAEEQD
jgi:hypothetical protein